jgi:hypothetical protein
MEAAQKFLKDATETLNGPIPSHSPDCDFCDWNPQSH